MKIIKSFAICLGCWRCLIVSRIWRKKNLPLYTTWRAQLKDPANHCNCTLLAHVLPTNCWSCWWCLPCLEDRVLLPVSISTPGNLIHCVGPSTFFQLILNPKSLSNWINVDNILSHSPFELPARKKSSMYATTPSHPHLARHLYTACVILWKWEGPWSPLNESQLSNNCVSLESPWNVHFNPVTL